MTSRSECARCGTISATPITGRSGRVFCSDRCLLEQERTELAAIERGDSVRKQFPHDQAGFASLHKQDDDDDDEIL